MHSESIVNFAMKNFKSIPLIVNENVSYFIDILQSIQFTLRESSPRYKCEKRQKRIAICSKYYYHANGQY